MRSGRPHRAALFSPPSARAASSSSASFSCSLVSHWVVSLLWVGPLCRICSSWTTIANVPFSPDRSLVNVPVLGIPASLAVAYVCYPYLCFTQHSLTPLPDSAWSTCSARSESTFKIPNKPSEVPGKPGPGLYLSSSTKKQASFLLNAYQTAFWYLVLKLQVEKRFDRRWTRRALCRRRRSSEQLQARRGLYTSYWSVSASPARYTLR